MGSLLGLHPLFEGTVYFAAFWGIMYAFVLMQNKIGKLSFEDYSIAQIVVSISVFAMWLFWICAWLHQWHPLIKPIYEE